MYSVLFGKAILKPKQYDASVLVISPLNSIVEEQVGELTKLGPLAVHLKENDPQCMTDISQRKFRFIFRSAER